MENETNEQILNFVHIKNDIRYNKFKMSNIGTAMENKLNSLGVSHNGKREIVLTAKNDILALLLENSDLNTERLSSSVQEETEKAKDELQALTQQ